MNETCEMLAESARRVMRSADTPGARWKELVALGLPLAAVDEARGGAGLSSGDMIALVRAIGGAPGMPLVEAMLAAHLLDRAGIQAPGDLAVIAAGSGAPPRLRSDCTRAGGDLPRVPWARDARHLVLVAHDGKRAVLALVSCAGQAIAHGANLADEPRDGVTLDDAEVVATGPVTADPLMLLAALRTAQIAAACATALSVAVEHARTRTQFGRAIGRFQAVQQNLAVMAGHTAAAAAAADLAAVALDRGGDHPGVAFAKIRAGEAAGIVAALAHQTLGAMGFSAEHPLHKVTKLLLSWRDEAGAESYWSGQAGRRLKAGGGARFWRAVTAT